MVESISNILKYLNKKNIYPDAKEFSFQVNSHPAFPSLLSIVSTLNIHHIRNYAVEIDNSEIDELPDDFMAFITLSDGGQELAVVEKKEGYYLVNGRDKMNEGDFLTKWNNIAVLIDESDSLITKKGYGLYKAAFTVIAAVILLAYLYYTVPISSFTYFMLSLCGLFLSVLSLKKIFGIENTVVTKVCSGAYTDCSFSGEGKNKNFISNFGDYSLAYFLTNVITLLFLVNEQQDNVFAMIQKALLVIIFPVIGYSLFYQVFRIRKICPLCIGIIIVLLLQTYSILK
ncbi:vitamin K epoxide reductase family protein [Chryseobacterium pennipullorum]|uniref:Vitamin K epoxide reductase family protein n=1 Tax=Chryseobacterium pennipullorum TaxID=2258963 RepID=A0A3D9AZ32_9FLAO|nr:vitamin K epoxide reductase family protein [Chryseobacterium pennipullorum]REC46247.1 hypothetical protein DRF67_14750 [Chryseobacterium pennipullorum]